MVAAVAQQAHAAACCCAGVCRPCCQTSKSLTGIRVYLMLYIEASAHM
jgi:hypothetical protein